MNTPYKYVSPEHNYTVFLNKYFVGKEAMAIAETKCRKANIKNIELNIILIYGYGIWLKKKFPDEFAKGVNAYKVRK